MCVTKGGKIPSLNGCIGVSTLEISRCALNVKNVLDGGMWPPSETRSGGAFRARQPTLNARSPFCAAGAAGLKTEPADGGGGIPRHAIREMPDERSSLGTE